MAKIPQSVIDVIMQESDRIIAYLDLEKIAKSPDPYHEFLRQFEEKFGKDRGLNLFHFLEGRYALLNVLYKNKGFQSKLPEKSKGSLNRKETRDFWQEEEKKGIIKKIERQRLINLGGTRFYSPRQTRFILGNQELPLKKLTERYNRQFGANKSIAAITSKRQRLLGIKK